MSRKKHETFAGTTALITGGASGLGLAMAEQLLADGARVLITDVHTTRPDGLPDAADYLTLDVRNTDDWAAARDHVEATFGKLDLLFNNAGIAVGGRIDHVSEVEWQRALDINLMGVVRGCATFTPMFKAQKSGTIVTTASLAGLVHAPAMATYNATKAAVVAVSESLWSELKPYGIQVSVICPSFFRTNLADSLAGDDVEMERAARTLIDDASRGADEIAAKALAGVRQGRFVILTDRDGHVAHRAKRLAPGVYFAAMADAGRRVAQGKPTRLPR